MKKYTEKISKVFFYLKTYSKGEVATPSNTRISCASICKGGNSFYACGDENKTIFLLNSKNPKMLEQVNFDYFN